jgi:hypothetical protein
MEVLENRYLILNMNLLDEDKIFEVYDQDLK